MNEGSIQHMLSKNYENVFQFIQWHCGTDELRRILYFNTNNRTKHTTEKVIAQEWKDAILAPFYGIKDWDQNETRTHEN